MRGLFLAITFALATTACAQAKEGIESAIRWLPTDTETLVVIQSGDFSMSSTTKNPLALDTWSMGIPEKGLQSLTKLPARFLVHGARKFMYPKSIGVGSFEGASIAGLDTKNEANADSVLTKSKLKTTLVSNNKVYQFPFFLGDGKKAVGLICVKSHCLIFGTNEAFVKTLLERMDSAPTERALPDSLEEWKYVNRSEPFWAIRHINPATQLIGWGLDMGDKKLRGYGVSVSSDRTLRIVSISDNPNAMSIVRGLWSREELKPKFEALSKTATEIRIGPEPVQVGRGFFFTLLALGYPIAV